MTELVKVAVPVGRGCKDCAYIEGSNTNTACGYSAAHRVDPECYPRVVSGKSHEYIYATPEKAALMRLRGELV
jgi:hypothetical protein